MLFLTILETKLVDLGNMITLDIDQSKRTSSSSALWNEFYSPTQRWRLDIELELDNNLKVASISASSLAPDQARAQSQLGVTPGNIEPLPVKGLYKTGK